MGSADFGGTDRGGLLYKVYQRAFQKFIDIDGTFQAGQTAFGLSDDGVGYSTSGGYLDDIVDELEAFKADIVAGNISVPDSME